MVGVNLIAHPLLADFHFCLDTLVFPVVIFQIKYLQKSLPRGLLLGDPSSDISQDPYRVGTIIANL